MFERTDYNGTALQMLWNAYYHILTSRTGVERDTLSILRLHANSEAISIQLNTARKYYSKSPTPLV